MICLSYIQDARCLKVKLVQKGFKDLLKVKLSSLFISCRCIASFRFLYFQQRTAFADSGTHDSIFTPRMQYQVSDIGKSVLAELQCPACKQFMVPTITLCQGGHNICNTCRPTVSSCPTCKQRFLKTRNVSLENLSLQMKFLCLYSNYGCKDTFPYNAVREHVAICGYSPQTCPVDYLSLKRICTRIGIGSDV